nr:PRKC apoptosis WT1 regulator protein [Vicugna pacos]
MLQSSVSELHVTVLMRICAALNAYRGHGSFSMQPEILYKALCFMPEDLNTLTLSSRTRDRAPRTKEKYLQAYFLKVGSTNSSRAAPNDLRKAEASEGDRELIAGGTSDKHGEVSIPGATGMVGKVSCAFDPELKEPHPCACVPSSPHSPPLPAFHPGPPPPPFPGSTLFLYLCEEWWEPGEAEKRRGEKGVEGRSRPGVGGAERPDAARLRAQERAVPSKRRSTGVVNIPAAECLDEYEDDEAGQKERKREDAITQQNTMQNEAASLLDPGSSYLLQEPSRTVTGRYKSTTTASEEDVSSRYPRTDRSGFSRYNRDVSASGNLVSSSTLEKKIEDLEKEVVRERQENLRLVRLMQDKEEMIGKLKEEIDLLNRDLDDIEDENEQLKQENKTLLKVVGQLTR